VITLQPDFPIPGPNSVSWVRCRPEEAQEVISEARATVAPHRLPVMWITDPETQPHGFAEHLAASGIEPDAQSPRADVMVLPIAARIETPEVRGLLILDALTDAPSFRMADAVAAEAFTGVAPRDDAERICGLERRRLNALAAGNRSHLLAVVDGEPAGSAGITLFPPDGATINGGAVRAKFRGRGVYRAMVAARLEIARSAGVEGLVVWGGAHSAPILSRLGFEAVGWRGFYVDQSTARP